jgi:hypothetical protein
MDTGITLQVNLAPSDLPHAMHTLPHQLRRWRAQVDEVLFTVDLRRSTGHYATAWEDRFPGFLKLMEEYKTKDPAIHVHEVDYSKKTRESVSQQFFGNQIIPERDYLGAPFYPYFAGFFQARYDYILHMDSDMLFGGGSQTWLAEAIRLMQQRPEIVACNPLPGPPTSDGSLRSQSLVPEAYTSLAFRSDSISTRIIFFDRRRLLSRLAPLPVLVPSRRQSYVARLARNPPYEGAESSLSTGMRQKGLTRMDFLGDYPGMWCLHPPYRSPLFYERLPALIQQVETGNIPDGQRGDHNLNHSMIDWGNASKTRWRRQVDQLQLILQRFTQAGSRVQ